MLKEKLKRNKGITLIALVVTIIVLLILAGISISMLTGQNGILKRSRESKIKNEIGVAQEALNMKISNNKIDQYTNNANDDIYDIEGFIKEMDIIENGEKKDIYVIKDLSKIGASVSIGKGNVPESDEEELSGLKDLLIIDNSGVIHYIDADGKKFDDKDIAGLQKVEGDPSEWEVEGDTVVKYLGTSNDIIIPNYVGGVKITKIGKGIFERSNKTGTLTISEGIEVIGERGILYE